jgi:D-alanyl-D-alanine carboxypeptidase (penicillin-binding protein 5/6)
VGKDLFMRLTDIQLLLDLPAELQEDGVRLYPDQHFYPDVPQLSEQGYFECFNAVLLGDADTGEILYMSNAVDPVPIASISKLMTYLLLAEADRAGTIRFYDQVPISAKAAALSQGADAMVKLTEGSSVPARELLQAMLLASSNESALAMAEYAAGSEEEFVERMNRRAGELGMETARFYNPHGLPVYLPQALTAKVQNRMSAQDLFLLCQAILNECPEITKITRERYGYLPTLQYNTANSNAVVFNLEGCNGLKTGSTNKAGSCLAATLPITVDGETHTAVAIVLGAESADARNQATEILLRYAEQTFRERGFAQPETGEDEG